MSELNDLTLDERCERVKRLVAFVFFPEIMTLEDIAFGGRPRTPDETGWDRIEEACLDIIHEVLQARALRQLEHVESHLLLNELTLDLSRRQRWMEEDKELGLTE